MTTVPQHDPLAFVFQLTPQTRRVIDECLETASTFAEALGNTPLSSRQSVLDELSLYVDIRNNRDGQLELYFKKHQEETGQKVEHWNLIFTVSVFRSGRNMYAIIDGERHTVYPTGNEQEPWTTNISYRKGE